MILEVQNGCFGYPKQPVILENINLRLEEGHILAILGPNGIGKTTLLKDLSSQKFMFCRINMS